MTLHSPIICALLIGMSFAPMLLALVLGMLPEREDNIGPIRIGNPLLKDEDGAINEPPIRQPLLSLTRVLEESRLREMILGLRFLPIAKTAPILKRYLHSTDAELQLYAQSIMQEGQEKLQGIFARLQPLATPASPANTASFIGAGLRLLDSSLTPESEHAAIIGRMSVSAAAVLGSDEKHSRLVVEAGRHFVRLHQFEEAGEMLARLPAKSPLHRTLRVLLGHTSSIVNPQPPLSVGYDIH